MTNWLKLFSVGLIASLASLPSRGAFAAVQCPGHNTHREDQGMHYGYAQGSMLPYDPATEITVSGTIDRIWTEDCLGCGCSGGKHFTLETKEGTYEAHLGPTCYLNGKGWDFVRGETVAITGALLPYRGNGKALVVREMKRGDETLRLRDEKGMPLWDRPPCP